MIRRDSVFGVASTLVLSLVAGGCGRAIQALMPLSGTNGGIDSGDADRDAGTGDPLDASGAADSDSDVEGSVRDAEFVADASEVWEAGDAADAGDASDASDASAEVDASISCDESTTCAAPIQLPTIWGGVTSGVNEQTNTYGEQFAWYLIEIQPYPPPAMTNSTVDVAITFEPPADVDYDLDVYLSASIGDPGTCAQTVVSSTDAGAYQFLNFSFPNSVSEVLGWVTIHVTAKPGAQCTTNTRYWLDVNTAL